MPGLVATPATLGELREAWLESDGFEMVQENMDRDDHGYAWDRIFKRIADGTFWSTSGVNQAGGEYDTLRDDCKGSKEAAHQVWPHQVTRTEYRSVPPKE